MEQLDDLSAVISAELNMADFRTIERDENHELEATEKEPSFKKKFRNLSKTDRKNAKKSSKMMQVVSRQIGVQISNEPNDWLVVWGIGIASGIGKQSVFDYFSPRPADVRLFVDQTYIFLRCFTKEDAVQLKANYHGVNFDDKQTLYVGYVDSSAAVPNEDLTIISPFKEPHPEGLKLLSDFVSKEEEALIIKNLFVETTVGSQLKRRTVQHFGYEFRYGTNDVDYSSPLPNKIPEYIVPVVVRMLESGVIPAEPDQLTVNQYSPGQGIPPHCDTHSCFEGPLVSLSLGSDIVMDFRQSGGASSIVLPSRSLLVMDGPLRLGWTHGITPRKWDVIPDTFNQGITLLPRQLRISLTFRRLRRGPVICNCKYQTLCDSQNGKITDENASSLENDLVHRVYEEIAGHFTETRHKPWPKVGKFVETLKPGNNLLDIGCANGKYFGINKEIVEVGMDMSMGLLSKCYEKGHQVLRANALLLPFHDDFFEGVISIAVLHHIATKDRRIKFLEEFLRVMAPGGRGLIYVWAKEQNLDKEPSTWSERQSERNMYNTPDACSEEVANYSFLPIHDRDLEFPRNDMLVPWVYSQEKQSKVHHRYYHVFTKGELEELVLQVTPSPLILDSYYEQGNWVVLIEKSALTNSV